MPLPQWSRQADARRTAGELMAQSAIYLVLFDNRVSHGDCRDTVGLDLALRRLTRSAVGRLAS